MTIYLRNATWLDPDTLHLQSSNICITKGVQGTRTFIDTIPPAHERSLEDIVIDCQHKLVSQAFTCGHHHIYSALARGMPQGAKAPQNFLEVLQYLWWKLDKCLDTDMIEASTLVTGLYCALNGVTSIIDHHASPFAIPHSLETIAKSLDKIGLSHLLCYEISCRDGEEIALQGLQESDNFLSSGRKGHVGLHASFTINDAILEQAVALAKKHSTGIHIHVAEDIADQEDCEAKYAMRVVERLHNAGALDLPKTILAHAIHLSENERSLIKNAPCWIVQNTDSNINNNVGLGRYTDFPQVMLGSDGMHSDMIKSCQSSYFIAAMAKDNMGPADAIKRLQNGNTHFALHGFSGQNNIIIFDYPSPTPKNDTNMAGHFCYGMQSSYVDTVISQGRIIVQNGKLCSEKAEDILAFANEQAARLWAKIRTL